MDINDQDVNLYFEKRQYHILFRNMVYIGDSDTDILCMKLVNINSGHSIGLYNFETSASHASRSSRLRQAISCFSSEV